jgi:hypothetical protein
VKRAIRSVATIVATAISWIAGGWVAAAVILAALVAVLLTVRWILTDNARTRRLNSVIDTVRRKA